MTDKDIKAHLIKSGVKNLKEFGYPDVCNENILTDYIYKSFFSNMLEENIGQSTKQVDEVINELLKEIK